MEIHFLEFIHLYSKTPVKFSSKYSDLKIFTIGFTLSPLNGNPISEIVLCPYVPKNNLLNPEHQDSGPLMAYKI